MKRLQNPPTFAGRLPGYARALLAASVLGTMVAVTVVIQACTLPLFLVAPRAARATNRAIVRGALSTAARFAEPLHGLHVEVTGDAPAPGENALLLVNHQQIPDVNLLFSLAWRNGRLGDLRWFAKEEVKRIPGIGWSMRLLDTVFVKRDWAKDEAGVRRVFAHLLADGRPFWLVIFPEGTRATPRKLQRAAEQAAGEGREPYGHLLPPHTAGFAASVGELRGVLGAVYDVTIIYPDGVPTLGQLLQGRLKRATVDMRRYDIKELPADREACAEWLRNLWREKDARLLNLYG